MGEYFDVASFLSNREGNIQFDLIFFTFICLNTLLYCKLAGNEKTTLRGALRRIKGASYLILFAWTGYKVWKESGDLPITIPELIGWTGVMFADLIAGIKLHLNGFEKGPYADK